MAQDTVINTFNNGINQDVDFILQPNGTYRNMKNGMLISMDGHTHSIELSNGNKVTNVLNARYNNTNLNLKDKTPMPIGFGSLVDDLIVFSTSDESDSGGYGEIGLLRFTKIGDDFISNYTPYYHHQKLGFTKYHKIEGFGFKENDNTNRYYWSDNNTEPKVLNFADPIFTTYYGINDLVVTKKYMVMGGVIEHNGYYYGPSEFNGVLTLPVNVNGNIFEAINNNYSVVLDNPLVIEYYPLELLNWTPSRSVGGITFKEYGGGSKLYGSNIYFYRLYSTSSKVYTVWSYPSSPIHVGGDNFGIYLGINAYNNFVGDGYDNTIVSSDKSIKIIIDNLDTNFDVIELCCMEFTQIDDVPYSIKIVAKENYTSSTIILEDVGNINLGNVSINDLTLFPANILRVKTLTTAKSYNIIANTTERNEFDFDLSGVTLSQFEYRMLVHGSISTCSLGNIHSNLYDPVLNSNPLPFKVHINCRYLVTDVTGGNIIYNGVSYTEGQVFVGVYLIETAIIPLGSQCRPCTTRNRYTPIGTTNRIENAIELKTGFWDYKDPAVASHNLGYWSKERYRFGILFFDKKGNPFYVKWIKDFDFSDVYSKNGLIIEGVNDSSYSLNPSGLNVSNLSLPQEVVDKISGFSIVRAPRDKRIIAQSLLMQNQINPAVGANEIMPIPTTITDNASYNIYNELFSSICPDYSCEATDLGAEITASGRKIEDAYWTNGSLVKSYNGNRRVLVTKLFNTLPIDPLNGSRTTDLKRISGVFAYSLNEASSVSDIDGTGRPYINDKSRAVGAYAYLTWDDTCHPGPSGGSFFNGDDNYSVGCKKLLIKSRVNAYNSNFDYGDDLNRPNNSKLVANFVTGKDKLAQYGGTSKSSIAATLYMSTGHFQPITNNVLIDVSDSTYASGPYIGQKKYTFNNIEVFGGDCYLNLIDIGYGLWKDQYQTDHECISVGIHFPCECNSNYNLRRGRKASNVDMYPNDPIGQSLAFDQGGSQRLEEYRYNKSYNTEGSVILYPGTPLNFNFQDQFRYRIRFAGEKVSGEGTDSFRKFLTGDFKDVDGKQGEINNIVSKIGKVLAFQNNGICSVPVLERQLLATTGGAATTIGTGGVVDRFDYISSYYGNQHQHGLTSTEYGYIWFDMRNRALCICNNEGGLQEISLIKGLNHFFNNQFNEGNVTGLSISDIYNTNSSNMPEIPLLGYGIVGVYDPRYKMSYLTFKFTSDILISEATEVDEEVIKLEAKDFTIGYSHVLNVIVGFYDFTPGIWHNHNDLVLSANNSKNYVYYGTNMPSTDFKIGDVVKDNGEYICISPVTISYYVANIPSGDNVHWLKINSENEIYLQTFNSQFCKFYGKVYDHEIEVVVNPKVDGSVSFLNIQQKGNNLNYTSVFVETDNQSAKDVNISLTNRLYKYINTSWFSSVPIDLRNGRLTDHYIKIKFVLKNYVSNPTIAINKQKIFQFLKTWFVSKK